VEGGLTDNYFVLWHTQKMMTEPSPLERLKQSLCRSTWVLDPRAALTVRLWAFAALPVLLMSFSVYLSDGLTNGIGKVIGEDFVNYWMGAKYALSGQAAEAYDFQGYLGALESFAGTKLEPYHYGYPPNHMLLTLPLAFLPFIEALVLWTVLGFAAVFFMVKPLLGRRQALLATFAAPAGFVNALYGQNGALSAVCLGGGLLVLESSPILSGVLFGTLSFKPQMGVLIPIALMCGGHWRAFASASVTVVALVLVSAGLTGWEAWFAFVERMSALGSVVLAYGDGVWHRMPSMFVSSRVLGADVQTAWLLQIPVSIACLVAVVVGWRREVSPSVKASILVLATLLATPYSHDYDFVVVVVVFAWRLKDDEWRPWEALALALVLMLPFWLSPAVKGLGWPIGPLAMGWALWTVMQKPEVKLQD